MSNEGKPSLRTRLFGGKAPPPDHGLTSGQPGASGRSANGPPSNLGKKGPGAEMHHRRFFSFHHKPEANSSNGDKSRKTRDAEQNTGPTGTGHNKNLDPWSCAYAELRNDDSTKKLVKTYEKILTYRANSSNPADSVISESNPNHFEGLSEAERVEKLSHTLQAVLDKHQEAKWWKDLAEGADMVVSKIRQGVGSALQSCPPAALGWSAICLLVPILVQPNKEKSKVADGLEYVLERMDWFISLTRVVMKTEWPENHPFKSHQRSTETEAVKLFKAMLKFEMECACREYETHPVVLLAVDMSQLGDWDNKLKTIKSLDNRISKDVQQYQLSELTECSSQIAENTEDLLVEVRQIKISYADAKQFKANEDLAKLISRFSKTTYFEQMRLNPVRHPGTCKWFCGHDKYKAWLKSTQNDLLLVTAEPGCGKSVLSRFLIEQDLPSRRRPGNNTEPIVCYVFFKDNTIQSSLANALGAIIYQLLTESKDTVTEFAMEIKTMSDEMLQGPETLWSLFHRVSKHKAFEKRTMYCVFDALDECAEDGRTKLIALLQDYLKLKPKRRVQFLVTSRPNPNIVTAFQGWTEKPVRLEGEGDKAKDDLQKEIDIVFRHRIEYLVKSKGLSDAVAGLLKNKLLTKGTGQRTYLWVRLIFELLEKATPGNLDDWNALLDDLPEGIPGVYDKLLSNVSDKFRKRVESLLHIVYIAYRPLTLREANIAVQVRGKYFAKSMESLGLDDPSFRTWLMKECGFFITEYDGRLFFIHQTAREFLRSSNFIKSDENTAEEKEARSELAGTEVSTAKCRKPWRNTIKSEADAHFVMAECCVASLMVTWQDRKVQRSATAVEEAHYEANKSPQWIVEPSECRSSAPWTTIKILASAHEDISSKKNDFFSYSSFNFLDHLRDANLDSNDASENEITPDRRLLAGTEHWLVQRGLTLPIIPDNLSQSESNPDRRPLADTEALLTACELFMTHPMRSVGTSDPDIMDLEEFEREAWYLLLRANKWMEQQDSCFVTKLQNLLKQVQAATTLRCSPIPLACMYSLPWMVRRSLGKNDEGRTEQLQMLCSTCQHSEELEILLAIAISLHSIGGKNDLHIRLDIACLVEVLRFEEQKLSDHPERVKYFLNILRLVRFRISQMQKDNDSTRHDLEVFAIFLDKMAKAWAIKPASSEEVDVE